MTSTDTPGAMSDGVPEPGAAMTPATRTPVTTPTLSPSALRRRRRRQFMAGWLVIGVLAGAGLTFVGHHGIYRWGWLAPLGGPSVPGTVQGPKVLTWRDAAGVVRRTTVDGARYHEYMLATSAALNKARTESSDIAQAKLQAETALIFAEIDDRVPPYAAWHFRYTTKYVLMAQAIYGLWTRQGGVPMTGEQIVAAIQSYLGQYLEDEYKDRLLHPAETRAKLEAAFERNVADLRARWIEVIAEQNQRFAEFIAASGGPGKPLDDTALGDRRLDWDLKIDAALPAEHVTYQTFRSGLLTIKASHPAKLTAGEAPVEKESDVKDRAGDVAQVVVSLFSSVIGPLANESGTLLSSMVAGTVGALAGHSAAVAAGAMPSTAIVVTAPLGALVGLAMTVSSDIATTRLEEHLTRPGFEQGVRDGLTKANRAIDKTFAALLEEHANARFLEASRLVGVTPVSGS
jgi:hypothetical protein